MPLVYKERRISKVADLNIILSKFFKRENCAIPKEGKERTENTNWSFFFNYLHARGTLSIKRPKFIERTLIVMAVLTVEPSRTLTFALYAASSVNRSRCRIPPSAALWDVRKADHNFVKRSRQMEREVRQARALQYSWSIALPAVLGGKRSKFATSPVQYRLLFKSLQPPRISRGIPYIPSINSHHSNQKWKVCCNVCHLLKFPDWLLCFVSPKKSINERE